MNPGWLLTGKPTYYSEIKALYSGKGMKKAVLASVCKGEKRRVVKMYEE